MDMSILKNYTYWDPLPSSGKRRLGKNKRG